MKKQILPLLMMLPALCAWGFDAYFYNGNTNEPALVAKSARAITFHTEKTIVTHTDFTTSEIANKNFDHMLFRDRPSTGLQYVAGATDAITVTVKEHTLTAASAQPIRQIEIVSAGGMCCLKFTPMRESLSADLSSLAPGIYVVRTATETNVAITKIAIK